MVCFYLLLPLVEYLREKSYLEDISPSTLESLSQLERSLKYVQFSQAL